MSSQDTATVAMTVATFGEVLEALCMGSWTCNEAESIHALMIRLGMAKQADDFMLAHAYSDSADEGDRHAYDEATGSWSYRPTCTTCGEFVEGEGEDIYHAADAGDVGDHTATTHPLTVAERVRLGELGIGALLAEQPAAPATPAPFPADCTCTECGSYLVMVESGYEREWTMRPSADDDGIPSADGSGDTSCFGDDGDNEYVVRCRSCLTVFATPAEWDWN